MKTFLASLLLLASCASQTPTVDPLPQPQLPVGSTFAIPCQEHGSHTQTIVGSQVVVVYDILGEDGSVQQAPEPGLLEFLETFGIPVDTSTVVR